uniref:hypothetical protein n=1 Tax=Cupriavidus necator TaxID=106590 RepID=UPI003F490CE4
MRDWIALKEATVQSERLHGRAGAHAIWLSGMQATFFEAGVHLGRLLRTILLIDYFSSTH